MVEHKELEGLCVIYESKKGPRLIPVIANVDDRGFLWQLFEGDNIKRTYIVGNFEKDTIRGFHMHKKESKWFFVPRGAIKIVTVDSSSNDIQTFVLSDKQPAVLYIPPGYANGWKALEEQSLLVGMSDKTLEESKGDDYRSDPMEYGDVWSVKAR